MGVWMYSVLADVMASRYPGPGVRRRQCGENSGIKDSSISGLLEECSFMNNSMVLRNSLFRSDPFSHPSKPRQYLSSSSFRHLVYTSRFLKLSLSSAGNRLGLVDVASPEKDAETQVLFRA